MVFEPNDAPREKDAFLDWYDEQMRWSEGQSNDDPSKSTPNLEHILFNPGHIQQP